MGDVKLSIELGGDSKNDLLRKLNEHDIQLNEFARVIFSSKLFQTSGAKEEILVEVRSIESLGFAQGATNKEIKERINSLGLSVCPLDVAPYLRLKLRSQQEVNKDLSLKNQSPVDAITVFSNPIIEDDNFPKGFYLRKMEGKLWLRGYTCTNDYVWKPNDKMVFKVVRSVSYNKQGLL